MWWTDLFLQETHEIERLTRSFEISLRTSFCAANPQNHVTIQRVNLECERLKNKVKKILEAQMIPTWKRFKLNQVTESAMFYINKFEEAKAVWIILDGDIIMKLAQSKSKKR